MASDDRSSPSRRYGDKAVRRLLELATKLQEEREGRGHGRHGEGLTLTQIQEAAAEAGIDPVYVQRAAARMDHSDTSEPGVWWEWAVGTPLTIRTARVVPGEITNQDFWQVPAEMDAKHSFLGPGSVSMTGRTLTWKSTEGGSRAIHVSVASRMGETRIHASEELHTVADNLFGGMVGAGGLAIGLGAGIIVGGKILGSTLLTVLFPVAAIGGLYFGARRLMKWISGRRRRILDGLLDRIADYARPEYSAEHEEARNPPTLGGQPPGGGRILPGSQDLPG
ncbi:MAG: hypothetical protein F4139_11140 [Gemmatimonadetes bacterium]|nr:hypothetical protein [Gemmatimonadota bacterium]MYH53475.1 hypothetical protein [Gemmatimonadota bacterium]MYK67281.1 hypothetical protein [Gemmatimonadota bacterium]